MIFESKGQIMEGHIKVFRTEEEYGKNSPMRIVVTNILGEETAKTLENGKSITIDLADGKYTISAVQGSLKSKLQEVEIKPGCTVNMKVTVIPAPTVLLEVI
jgi:hypothetical protein